MTREVRRYSSDEFDFYRVTPVGWPSHVQLPVIRRRADNTFFWPVAAICEDVLGIQTWRQLQKIKASRDLKPYLCEFDVQTRKGQRTPVFLDFQGLAPWFQTITRVQDPELSDLLDKFKAAAVRAVNEILWGHNKPVPPTLVAPSGTKFTLADTQAHVQFIEGRVENIEDKMFQQPFVNDFDADGAGMLNIPFFAPHGGKFIIRLRQLPWQAPEVVEIIPDNDPSR